MLGVVVIMRPPLASVGNTATALALGMAALIPPIWLALIDHVIWPAPRIGPIALTRALTASLLAAAISWGAYALVVPIRFAQTTGLDLPARAIVLGLGSSLILDLYVFIALFLAIAAPSGVLKVVRPGGAGEYWLPWCFSQSAAPWCCICWSVRR